MAELDHIVVGAHTLAQGEAWAAATLGVACTGGGAHERMGTHNRVLSLGDGRYLEIIAIDPHGKAPFMPRWFGLDMPALQAQLQLQPRLIAWVARTNDVATDATHLPDPTMAHPMQRGDLRWTFLFTPDGSRLADGLLPHLIQWHDDATHPAARLPDSGCRLVGLRGLHPAPQPLNQALSGLKLKHNMAVRKCAPHESPQLQAMIQTPAKGVVVI